MSNAKPLIQSLERALDVLECLGASPDPLRASEVSRAVNLHANTVNNILRTLYRRAYLVQHNDGRYSLGPQCCFLGSRADTWHNLRDAALPVLHTIAQKTACNAFLAVSGKGRVFYVAHADEHGGLRVSQQQKWLDRMHCTAAGKVLLAYGGSSELDLLKTRDPLDSFTKKTITSWNKLEREMRITAKRGYALCVDESSLDVAAIGVPVLKQDGTLLAALAQSFPSYYLESGRILPGDRAVKLSRYANMIAEKCSIGE